MKKTFIRTLIVFGLELLRILRMVLIKRNLDKTTLTLITCTKDDDNSQTVYIAELVN